MAVTVAQWAESMDAPSLVGRFLVLVFCARALFERVIDAPSHAVGLITTLHGHYDTIPHSCPNHVLTLQILSYSKRFRSTG